MKLAQKILEIIIIGLLFSCSNQNESKFIEILNKTDKIYLYKMIDNDFCPIKSFDSSETYEMVELMKRNYDIQKQREFIGDYKLELFDGDSLIGTFEIINGDSPYANFNSSGKGFGTRLNYGLGRYFEDLTPTEYVIHKSNATYYNQKDWLEFDRITVMEFVKLLPATEVAPNLYSVIITQGQADSNWISKEDIPELIKLINSEQPAYCVMRVVSSTLPFREESTMGGQVMNLIDSYRLNKPYPFFLTNCSKTDRERQQEILEWWANINK